MKEGDLQNRIIKFREGQAIKNLRKNKKEVYPTLIFKYFG